MNGATGAANDWRIDRRTVEASSSKSESEFMRIPRRTAEEGGEKALLPGAGGMPGASEREEVRAGRGQSCCGSMGVDGSGAREA